MSVISTLPLWLAVIHSFPRLYFRTKICPKIFARCFFSSYNPGGLNLILKRYAFFFVCLMFLLWCVHGISKNQFGNHLELFSIYLDSSYYIIQLNFIYYGKIRDTLKSTFHFLWGSFRHITTVDCFDQERGSLW